MHSLSDSLLSPCETEGKKLERTEGVFSFNRDCNCPGQFMVNKWTSNILPHLYALE